jgi:hypothetical protein
MIALRVVPADRAAALADRSTASDQPASARSVTKRRISSADACSDYLLVSDRFGGLMWECSEDLR